MMTLNNLSIRIFTAFVALVIMGLSHAPHAIAQDQSQAQIETSSETPSEAQSDTQSEEAQPLEITADNALEWYRDEQKLIALGNAIVKQGDTELSADTITATYHEGAQGRYEITKIIAENNVILSAQDSQAYGDYAIYTLKDNLATMTGSDLRMISTDQTVTAQDKFEYHVLEGKLRAIGNARATRPNKTGGTDTLQAKILTANFIENAQGKRVLNTLEAENNVIITTAEERIIGAYGIYKSVPNTAEITGDVKITRGPNILEGKRALVDLNTNKSKIFGGNTGQPQDRVKAVFFPESN